MIWLARIGVLLLGGIAMSGVIVCLREAGLPSIWNWWCLSALLCMSVVHAIPAAWEIKR